MRSLLYAPGNRPEVAAKLPRSGPDAGVIDLEDAVAVADKDTARGQAASVAATLVTERATSMTVLIRVNAVPTPWFADDVAAAIDSGADGIVVPKVEHVDHLHALVDARQHGLTIVAGIESAWGVARAIELLGAGIADTVYFGAEDYIADIGGVRTGSNAEVLYARSQVALAARLAGIGALDQIVPGFDDDARFTADAAQGRAIGYHGKMCIHPRQVALAHAAFGWAPADVDRAQRIVTAYESGSGVVVVDGQMIDEPLVKMARAVLRGS